MSSKGDRDDKESSEMIIFEVVYSSLCFVWVGTILTFFLRQIIFFRDRKDVSNLSKFLKFGATGVLTLYGLAAGISLGFLVQVLVSKEQSSGRFNTVVGVCYGSGLLLLILTFIHRFHLVISDSTIFSDRSMRLVFYSIWGSLALIVATTVVGFVLFVARLDAWNFLFGAAGTLYIVLAFSLLSLFLYSLISLARVLGTSTEPKVHRKIGKLVDSMTSYSILVTAGLLSSLIFGTSFLVFGLDSDVALCSDIFVNSLCLYMQFPFSKSVYNFACKCCHIAAEKVFWGSMSPTQRASVRQSVGGHGIMNMSGGDGNTTVQTQELELKRSEALEGNKSVGTVGPVGPSFPTSNREEAANVGKQISLDSGGKTFTSKQESTLLSSNASDDVQKIVQLDSADFD